MPKQTSRRHFLKTSSVITASAAIAGGLSIAQSAHAVGSDEIKIALIGSGRRGQGAIRDRALVGDNIRVVAVADAGRNAARIVYGG